MNQSGGILIVGAAPQCLRAALSLADSGRRIVLAASGPELNRPPDRWNRQGRRWFDYLLTRMAYHPLITVMTETEMGAVRMDDGRVVVDLIRKPAWVRPDLCVNCGACLEVCPVEGARPLYELTSPSARAIDKRKKAPAAWPVPWT